MASGIQPFVAALVAGVLARLHVGLDLGGTGFAFAESLPFLAAMVLLAGAVTAWNRRGSERALAVLLTGAALALGAIEFGASLAGEGYSAGPGIVAGVLCAGLARAGAGALVRGAGARLAARAQAGSRAGTAPATYLPLYVALGSAAVAFVAVAVPPVSYVALGLCGWVLAGHARRRGRKYGGLRVLR